MPPKIVVLCHVEPGTVQGRTIIPGFERTEGITRGLPRVLEFADRWHIPMGLALTPQALKLADVDLAGHEAGLHIHPMDPVLSKRLAGQVRTSHDCLGRYPPAEQALLIAAACESFEARMGRRPRLFVAGRWSEDATTAALLRKEGFTHDGSALPGYRSPCADWSRVPRLAQPYSPASDDPQKRGSEPYVYLPVFQGVWGHHFTPETLRDLGVSYFKAALKEAQVGGADIVHIYFHSPLGLDPVAMAAFAEVLEYARDAMRLSFLRPTAVVASAQPRSGPFPPAYWAGIDVTLMKSFVGRRMGRRLRGAGLDPVEWDGISTGVEGERGA